MADSGNIKEELIGEIMRARGLKSVACRNLNVNPRTFYKWLKLDAEFREAVEEAVAYAREEKDDLVEQKLFDLINAGDTAATLFYCKTRLKNRGYSEKAVVEKEKPRTDERTEAVIQVAEEETMTQDVQKKIQAKKVYITRLLKQQNKYSPELSMQVKIVAQLLVRTEILASQIFDTGYNPTNVEISREGNERETINPKEKLYLDLLQQSQKALKALGMNTDSKDRKNETDGFSDFLNQFK